MVNPIAIVWPGEASAGSVRVSTGVPEAVSVRGVAPERLPAKLIARDTDHSLLDVGETDGLSRLLAVVQEQGGEVSSVFPRHNSLEELILPEAQGSEDRS